MEKSVAFYSLLVLFAGQSAFASMKVITYNVYLFSGRSGYPMAGYGERDHVRARHIAQQIINDKYDVAVFQELFSVPIREKMVWRFQINGYDVTTGLEKEGRGYENSGMLVASRFPIQAVPGKKKAFYWFEQFKNYQSWDRFASKGILGVVVDTSSRFGPDHQTIFFATHTNANTYSNSAQLINQSQFTQIREFIVRHVRIWKKAHPEGRVSVVLMGDLNVPGDNVGLHLGINPRLIKNADQYTTMTTLLAGARGLVRDAWRMVHPNPTTHPGFTQDCANEDILLWKSWRKVSSNFYQNPRANNCDNAWQWWRGEPGQERLDYVMLYDRLPDSTSADLIPLTPVAASIPKERFRHGGHFMYWPPKPGCRFAGGLCYSDPIVDDSDHFPLAVELTLGDSSSLPGIEAGLVRSALPGRL